MPKKTPGKVISPPDQAVFGKLPLARFCRSLGATCYRLHSIDRATGRPWPPVHFSQRGNTRFDPATGIGTLCVADNLAGALMEIFDDQWDAVGSLGRSLTSRQLAEWRVTRISLPEVTLFDATGANLSKIGADAQLLTGLYRDTRPWALRLMNHPAQIDGILYFSRHDPKRQNIALFRRARFEPYVHDPNLSSAAGFWTRPKRSNHIIYGRSTVLESHSELSDSLIELEVAILP